MIKSGPKHESYLARFWPVLLIGGVWLWIFWPMMTGQKVVGFRDSAYLYYPLFKWIDAQWAAGEIPLWNPYCNFGMPVVADGTSSVFYPGKLIFFCWFLSYPARYGIYLAMHVPLAAAGSYWFARTLRANQAGATLAAFSFALGGSVLFQVTNVIYLVSAAWLPFALCCVWKMVKTGELRWAVAAGVACALMILGGDPQMVYHVGLIAVATVVGQFVRRIRNNVKTKSSMGKSDLVWLLAAGSRVGVMVLVTSLLAAIQLLPTYYWSELSERTNPLVPANVYQGWNSLRQDGDVAGIQDALLADPIGTAEHSYQFSQPPWSLSELAWPNISGRPFPTHQRWTSGLAGADRMWVPSLYAGLVTLLLGMLGFRFWGRRRKQVWLTYLFFFFLLGSFGWYGMVWLVIEVYPPVGLNTKLGPQVGGLYWLMNMFLPKYFAFRYPAKLFVISSLALSVLAGVNFRNTRMKRAYWLSLVFVGLTACGLAGFNSLVQSSMSDVFPDTMFGPFDLAGASSSFHTALIHTLVTSACLFVLFLVINHFAKRKRLIQLMSVAIVAISAGDILISNRWLVPVVDASVFESENPVQARLQQLRSGIEGAEPIRVYRSTFDLFEPVLWERQGSDHRLSEVIAWQRETLYPKHHLGENVVLLGSFSSIWPSTYQEYLEQLEWYREGGVLRNGRQATVLKMFHGSFEINDDEGLAIKSFAPISSFGSALPIDWMFEFDPESETLRTSQARCLWTQPLEPIQKQEEKNDLKIVEFENSRFIAQISTDRPRVLAFFGPVDHGWKVKVRDLETNEMLDAELIELHDWLSTRSNQFTNTLLLQFPKAGRFEVEFIYRPREFFVGAWISGCSWLILILALGTTTLRRRRSVVENLKS